ncbi:DNA ligase D [Patescibacteria group bacterium]|nr:DNA ligase D [Patescibacteria group bacterium]
MVLEQYKKKRDFKSTPEPPGEHKPNKGFNFVVQKHAASHLHYDFRLEIGGVLVSWAIPKGPSVDPQDKRLAIMTEDHPLDYLTFEGIIPKGNYGAGTVIVWDIGTYQSRNKESIKKDLTNGKLTIILRGKKLKGEYGLVKIKNSEKNWLLIKKRDEFADTKIDLNDRSVLSKKTMTELEENSEEINFSHIPKCSLPKQIKPMLTTLIAKPFNNDNFVFEIKWDGYRAIAQVENNDIELYSRNFISYNTKFRQIFDALKDFKKNVVLDGEIVVLDEKGKPSFELLQNYHRNEEGRIVYYIFDLIYYDEYNFQSIPLVKRKSFLKDIIPENPFLKYSDHIEEKGEDFFRLIEKQNMEGIIAKKKDSLYLSGKRTKAWLKIKTHQRQEAVICGYTKPRGSRKYLGALVLGAYQNKKLLYIGHANPKVNEQGLRELKEKLDLIVTNTSPFNTLPKTNMPVTWVKPEIVVEVKFSEWTKGLNMRQPVVIGIREDKSANEPVIELPKDEEINLQEKDKIKKTIKVGSVNLKLTNLNKIFWPNEGYTKKDLIDYYLAMKSIIMPYLIDRPESLHRYPDGIDGEDFYQKNMPPTLPKWIKTTKIRSEHEEKDVRYYLCQNEESLIYLINFGCIDLNPWSSRIQNLDFPDFMVIDLDPEDISFDYVIEAALAVKKILDKLGIASYPKTSGATGMHIYIPTGSKYTYEQIKVLGKIIVTLVQNELPKTTSIIRNPSNRQKRVYLDFLQNVRGQTLAAAYSVRPVPGATVSTPLFWEEVKTGLSPNNYTIRNIVDRVKKIGDIFKPVLGDGIDIDDALKKIG